MRALPEIKKDMEFNKNLNGLLEVLKGIATAQFTAMQSQVTTFEPFSEAVKSFMGNINPETVSHPFLRPTAPAGVVAITSDNGLVGGLNRQVMGAALEQMERGSQLVVVGERGVAFAEERKIPHAPFPGVSEENRMELATQLRDDLAARVLSGSMGPVHLVHPAAVSFSVRHIQSVTLIPCTDAFGREAETDAAPVARGFLFESTPDEIVEYVAFLWLGRVLYEALGHSRLAEFSARSMHLEQGTQELGREGVKLKQTYHRARRELIDRSLRELFAARGLHG